MPSPAQDGSTSRSVSLPPWLTSTSLGQRYSLTSAGPESTPPAPFQRGNLWLTPESKPLKEAASCRNIQADMLCWHATILKQLGSLWMQICQSSIQGRQSSPLFSEATQAHNFQRRRGSVLRLHIRLDKKHQKSQLKSDAEIGMRICFGACDAEGIIAVLPSLSVRYTPWFCTLSNSLRDRKE